MVSLNVNGLTASKLITVLGHLKSKEPGAPMAFTLQETHETIPDGVSVGVVEGCVIIRAAEAVQPVGCRQSRGVAIVLGPMATRAWRASAGRVVSSSPRHVVVSFRLHARSWGLASAYGPHGSGPAEVQQRQDFIGALSGAVEALPRKAIWLCGGDLNACVGAANRSKVTLADRQLWKHYRKPVGQYGLARRTAAGDVFLDWLSSANLCLTNTFFHQPRSDGGNVGTWRHPASREWYQLDYFIASTDTRVRYIVDSGKYDRYSVLSDHAPIAVKLKVPCPGHLSGGRQRGSASARAIGDPGADLRSLRWPETAARFNTDVLDVMALKAASPPPQQALGGAASLPVPAGQDELSAVTAEWITDTRAKVSALRADSMVWMHSQRCLRSAGEAPTKPPRLGPGSVVRALQPDLTSRGRVYGPETSSQYYTRIKEGWAAAATALPRKPRFTRNKDWYAASRDTLDPWRELVIQRRTEHRNAAPEQLAKARKRLKHAKRRYRQEARDAKEAYTLAFLSNLNPHDMGSLFKAAKTLAEGLGQQPAPAPSAGAVSREKVEAHFQDIWTINRPGIDLSVVDQVEQRPVRRDLDCPPGIEEVAEALAAAKNGVATADKSLPAEFCKCMLEDEAALAVFTEFLQRTWNSGSWDGGLRPVEDIQVDLRDWDSMSQKEQLQWAEKLDLRLHWMQDNPKDPGPDRASHTRYETYKKATTLSEARRMVGASWTVAEMRKDLKWDMERGFLRVFPHSTEENLAYVDAPDMPEEWPEDWQYMRGKLLYKGKGSTAEPDNYRMIIMGDFAQSILGGVMLQRLRTVLAEFGIEEQMGFTKNRSTVDAIFTLLQAVAKRRQHGQDTWMAFIDLRKAYPSVPRDVLFRILEKFGIPSHFRQVLQRFYTDLTVRVDFGSEDPLEMPAGRTGLREGCRLSPILWLFVIQAVLSLVEPLWQGSLQFRTCLSAHARTLAGKPAEAKGTLRAGVSLWTLLLADDMWVAADTRANLAANLDTFVRIGRAFGLEMHAAASPGADSKTLAMMVPAADSRTDQDLRDIQLEDGRTVPFATVVKYLGTMISSDWTDTVAVKTRMDKANGMFAMNKKWLCSKDASALAKARYYET